MAIFWTFVRSAGLGLVGFMFPRVLVGMGIPADQFAICIGQSILGAREMITPDFMTNALGIALGLILITAELWFKPVDRFVKKMVLDFRHILVSDVVAMAIDKHEKKKGYSIPFLYTLEGFGSYATAIPSLAKAITEYVDIFGIKSGGKNQNKIDTKKLKLNHSYGDDYKDEFNDDASCIKRHSFRTTTTSIPEPELLWSNVSIKRKDIKTALDKLQTHDFD